MSMHAAVLLRLAFCMCDNEPSPLGSRQVLLPSTCVRHYPKRRTFWCTGTGSNRRHPGLQPSALPTELPVHIWLRREDLNLRPLGHEPSELISALPRNNDVRGGRTRTLFADPLCYHNRPDPRYFNGRRADLNQGP